jgi:hypothetical protein
MSASTLASRLDRRFDLLTGPALPPRQRTLRATLDWSFELLSSNAQRLFAALSAFRGGFTLDTAEMIAAAIDLDPDEVAPLVADLADQSMIRAELPAQGNTRYRMLDTMQAYAAEYLTLMKRQEVVHARHASYFVELAERAALYRRGPLEPAWVMEVETEFDNMRAALRWAVDSGHPEDALRLVAALADDAMMRERFEIGRWAVELAAIPEIAAHPLRAIALALGGNIAMQEYRLDDARRLAITALALEEQTGCRPSWVAHNTLAILAAADSSDAFRAHVQAMAEIGATTGDRFAAAMADWTRGLIAVMTGHPDRGRDAAEHLLALGTETGNPSMLAMGLLCHGQVVASTDPELAAQEYHDGLTAASAAHNTLVGQQCLRAAEALRARSGDQPAALESLRGVAQRFERSGNVAQQLQTVISMLDSLVALDALEATATICGALSRTPFTPVCQMVDRAVAERLPRDRYLAARRAGRAMTASDVVTFASGLVKDLASER